MKSTNTVIKRCFESTLFCFFVFLIISLLVHVPTVIKTSGYIDGGDTDYFINEKLEFLRGLNVLRFDGNGSIDYFATSKIVFSTPALIMNFFIHNPVITNNLYFIVLFALIGFTMFVYLKTTKLTALSIWLGSIFFMLNPYVFMRFHTPIIHLEVAYLSLPLLLWAYQKYLQKGPRNYFSLLVISVTFLALSRTTGIYLLYLLLIPVILWFSQKSDLFKKDIEWKKLISLYVTIIITNAMFLSLALAQIPNYLTSYEGTSFNEYYRMTLQETQSRLQILDVFSGFGNYAWMANFTPEKAGVLGYSLLAVISKKILLLAAEIPAVFATIYLLRHNKYLGGLLIVVIILATGLGSPTGYVYKYIADFPIYRNFFRDPWGYWGMIQFFLYALGFSIGIHLLTYKLKHSIHPVVEHISSLLIAIPALIALVFNIGMYYIYPGSLVQKEWTVKVPNDYDEFAQYANNHLKAQKVLSLPVTTHFIGYTHYNWTYNGPDVLSKMAPIWLQDVYLAPYGSSEFVNQYQLLYKPSAAQLLSFLDQTATQYILLRKDIETDTTANTTYLDWLSIITQDPCFQKQFTSDNLDLYRFACDIPTLISISTDEPLKESLHIEGGSAMFYDTGDILSNCYEKKTGYIIGEPFKQEDPQGCYYATLNVEKANSYELSFDIQTSDHNIPLFRYCLWSGQQNKCLLENYVKKSVSVSFVSNSKENLGIYIYTLPYSSFPIHGSLNNISLLSFPTSSEHMFKNAKNIVFESNNIQELEDGITSLDLENMPQSFYFTIHFSHFDGWALFGNDIKVTQISSNNDLQTIWYITNNKQQKNTKLWLVYKTQIVYLAGMVLSFGSLFLLLVLSLLKNNWLEK